MATTNPPQTPSDAVSVSSSSPPPSESAGQSHSSQTTPRRLSSHVLRLPPPSPALVNTLLPPHAPTDVTDIINVTGFSQTWRDPNGILVPFGLGRVPVYLKDYLSVCVTSDPATQRRAIHQLYGWSNHLRGNTNSSRYREFARQWVEFVRLHPQIFQSWANSLRPRNLHQSQFTTYLTDFRRDRYLAFQADAATGDAEFNTQDRHRVDLTAPPQAAVFCTEDFYNYVIALYIDASKRRIVQNFRTLASNRSTLNTLQALGECIKSMIRRLAGLSGQSRRGIDRAITPADILSVATTRANIQLTRSERNYAQTTLGLWWDRTRGMWWPQTILQRSLDACASYQGATALAAVVPPSPPPTAFLPRTDPASTPNSNNVANTRSSSNAANAINNTTSNSAIASTAGPSGSHASPSASLSGNHHAGLTSPIRGLSTSSLPTTPVQTAATLGAVPPSVGSLNPPSTIYVQHLSQGLFTGNNGTLIPSVPPLPLHPIPIINPTPLESALALIVDHDRVDANNGQSTAQDLQTITRMRDALDRSRSSAVDSVTGALNNIVRQALATSAPNAHAWMMMFRGFVMGTQMMIAQRHDTDSMNAALRGWEQKFGFRGFADISTDWGQSQSLMMSDIARFIQGNGRSGWLSADGLYAALLMTAQQTYDSSQSPPFIVNPGSMRGSTPSNSQNYRIPPAHQGDIYLPIEVSSHWVLAVIQRPQSSSPTAIILDSMQADRHRQVASRYIQAIRQSLGIRPETMSTLASAQQTDSSSCGLWVLSNFRQMVRRQPLEASQPIAQRRVEWMRDLTAAAVVRPASPTHGQGTSGDPVTFDTGSPSPSTQRGGGVVPETDTDEDPFISTTSAGDWSHYASSDDDVPMSDCSS